MPKWIIEVDCISKTRDTYEIYANNQREALERAEQGEAIHVKSDIDAYEPETQWDTAIAYSDNSNPIAYFDGRRSKLAVICLECYNDPKRYKSKNRIRADVPIYQINLGQYSQNCHECNAVIQTGTFNTQLFERPE